jgi:hypothetical protein
MEESIKYGQENFSLPHDVVKLPSGGVYYKSKKKAIKVGYLTAADENILMGGSYTKEGVIMTLLRNKIYEPDLRPDELLEGDLQAILIFLRNSSFGPEYTFKLKDPETNREFEHVLLMDQINFKIPKETPDDEGLFTTKLPKSGLTVKIKPLSYGETEEVERMAQNYPPNRVPPKLTWRLSKMVIEINGNRDSGSIIQTIETLPIIDSKYIRNFISENEPGLDLRRTIIAPSGKEIPFEISFGAEFFRPFF